MKKEFIKYGFYTVIFILFLMFVYPTMYRYDKYDQKIPVKINRITGATSMLYQDGWEKAEQETPSISEMEQFKKDMETRLDTINNSVDNKFNGLKEEIENDTADKLSAQVIAGIKEDIAKAKSDISDYKKAQLDPNNSFGKGSSMDEVKKIMGVPSSTYNDSFGDGETWFYDLSTVTFKNKKVLNWSDSSHILKLK